MISVGVVIPAFGRTDELARAITSVLTQTRPPDDIVVVDDGSKPPLTVAGPHGAHVKVRLVRHAVNQGAAAARQTGVEALSTTHVAFLDSDDTWLPEKLERQLEILETAHDRGATAVTCGWRYQFDDGVLGPVMVPRPAYHVRDFASGCWFCPGSTVVMSRAMLLKAGGFDARLRRLEDLDLFIRFAQAGGILDTVTGAGVIVRRGYNGKIAPVDQAAALLTEKFVADGPRQLPPDAQRRLRSWLAVERAVAARNEGKHLQMLRLLAASFALVPRRQIQLSPWWTMAAQ